MKLSSKNKKKLISTIVGIIASIIMLMYFYFGFGPKELSSETDKFVYNILYYGVCPVLIFSIGLLIGVSLYLIISPGIISPDIKLEIYKENKNEIIKIFETSLEVYKSELEKDPTSFFFKGMVKNTEEYIDELKNKI